MANKPGDFGGLPNDLFTAYLTFYRDTVNATLDASGQRARALAGLAAQKGNRNRDLFRLEAAQAAGQLVHFGEPAGYL